MDDVTQITALIHAERLDAGDLDGVKALFAHAMWRSFDPEPLRGTAAVRKAYDGVILYDGIPCTKHVVTHLIVAIDGDDATARSYFTVLQARPTGRCSRSSPGATTTRSRASEVPGASPTALTISDLIGDLSRHLRR